MNTQSSDSACPKYQGQLEDFLDGQLSAAEFRDIRAHLAECAGCADALEAAQESVTLLHLAEPAEKPSPRFARTVMARIQADEVAQTEERASFWRPIVALAWRFAATATIAVILLLTYDMVGNSNQKLGVASGAQAEAIGIFSPEPVNLPATRDETLLMVAETSYGSD